MPRPWPCCGSPSPPPQQASRSPRPARARPPGSRRLERTVELRRAARPRRQCAGQPRDGRAASSSAPPVRTAGSWSARSIPTARHLPHQGDRAGSTEPSAPCPPGAGPRSPNRSGSSSRTAFHVGKHHASSATASASAAASGRAAAEPVKVVASGPGRRACPRHQLPSRRLRSRLRWAAAVTGIYRLRAFAARNRKAIGGSSARRRITVYRYAAASWYGPGLYGNTIACGGTLTPATLGVANKYLPCGTRVKLRYRGPHCHGAGRRPRAIRRGSRVRPHLRHQAAPRVPRHRLRALDQVERGRHTPRRSWSASFASGSAPVSSKAATLTPSSRTGRGGRRPRSRSRATSPIASGAFGRAHPPSAPG